MRHREDDECMAFAHWLLLAHPHVYQMTWHNVNGARLARGSFQGARLKAMGAKKGVPDYTILYPSNHYHGLIIEMKAVSANGRKGRATKEQREWIENLNSLGYSAHVCVGLEAAQTVVEEYLRSE